MSPNFYKALNYDVTSVIILINGIDKNAIEKNGGQKYFNETKLPSEEHFAKLFQKFICSACMIILNIYL